MEGDYFKMLTSDKPRMKSIENSCMVDTAYILEKCKELLDKQFGEKYAENNPVLLAALIQSATEIFIHKPRE